MIRKIQRPYFEVWGDAEAQNVILKWLLLLFAAVIIIESASLVAFSLRKPVLIGLGAESTKTLTPQLTTPELLEKEAKRTISVYIQNHYTWDAKTIDERFSVASRYVAEKQLRGFQLANAEQIKTAKEKKVAQRVHVNELLVDMKARSARVAMDRIFDVEGIRAVTPLILDLNFEFGPRTDQNPEGFYVFSERNITSTN